MKKIFESFLQNKALGKSSILDAYSEIYEVKRSWLSCEKDISVQELIDSICDDLESQGYDLSSTSTDEIKKYFVLYKVEVKAPEGYADLMHAKEITQIALENINSTNAEEKYKNQISSMLDLIESKLKELS